jgi:hypothetical protein
MKLYKYRSLQRFEFVADILCRNQFYAAQYFELNDPMEGLFDYDPETKREYLDSIVEGKLKLRVVSLSKTPSDLLLWAHYADGFSGICVEVEVQPNAVFDCEEITYSPFRTYFSNKQSHEVENWPRYILRGKNAAWSYEKEVRLFAREKFVSRGIKVTAVLLGIRTPEVLVEALQRLSRGNFPIYRTKISDITNQVERAGRIKANPTNPHSEFQ